jgi:hypothetical protein
MTVDTNASLAGQLDHHNARAGIILARDRRLRHDLNRDKLRGRPDTATSDNSPSRAKRRHVYNVSAR